MDNKDFEKVSIALRDGTLNNPELIDSLNSLGENKSLPVVLDAMFHKIANTDHDFNSNKLPVNTSDLPEIYRELVKQTTSYLQTKIDNDDIERIDHQLYTNLNYNLGNLVVRPSEIAPLIYDDALKTVLIVDQLPTQTSEDAYNVLEGFKHKTPFLDLEDVAKSLNEKLADFDASSNSEDVQKIISLSQKQRAFKDAQEDDGDFQGNVVNYNEYKPLIDSNEKKLNEFLDKAESQKNRDVENSNFIKLFDEIEKGSYEEEVIRMTDSIKNSQKVFDRRLQESLSRDEIENAFDLAQEPTLIISEGPDAAKIQAKRKKELEDLDILTEIRDWDAKFQETLRALNSRELRTFDKLRKKAQIGDPNGGLLNTAKLLGESIVVLNELGNADKTLLNVSPLTGTMRLGRDTPPDSESGIGALKLAALNARRKGWDKVYLNHPGKDHEAIPFIKAAIRAMVIEGEYELDQIKVPKRFQKLIENYRLENPELSLSSGNDVKNKEEYVSASELNKEVINSPENNQPANQSGPAPIVPPVDASATNTDQSPKPDLPASEQAPSENSADELVPDAPKVDGVPKVIEENSNKKNNNVSDLSEIPHDAINVKGQPALPDYMKDNDMQDFMHDDNFMNSFVPDNVADEPVDLDASAKAKAMQLFQHSRKLSESGAGYVHQPIFDVVQDLIKESKSEYWASIGSLSTKDTPLAAAIQDISRDYIESSLFSPKNSELVIKKLNSDSGNKLETLFEKNMGRELTNEESQVLKKHSAKISEYLDGFVNKGEYSLVVIDANGMRNIKDSPEKLDDFINTAEMKRTSDRNILESIGKYSELKKEGKELFEIYDNLNLDNLTSAGLQIQERREYEQQKSFASEPSDTNNKNSNNSSRKMRP
jgi:hypothetical protein